MAALRDRIKARTVVDEASGCILWEGSKNEHGYGLLSVGGRKQRVHRLAYELEIGPIPQDRVIDHLCRMRACVNTAHLELVTVLENSLRGEHPRLRRSPDRYLSARAHRPTDAVRPVSTLSRLPP